MKGNRVLRLRDCEVAGLTGIIMAGWALEAQERTVGWIPKNH